MARAAFYYKSRGASISDRVGALEEFVEQVSSANPLSSQANEAIPHSIHFGGGSVYPNSSDFPLWLRGTDAAPYATTLLTYNQFPMNAYDAALGFTGALNELMYVTGTSAANQLDFPLLAHNRSVADGTLLAIPYQAYIDNVDVELGFSVNWTPDAIAQKRPWHCRMVIISDNEPFMQDTDANSLPNTIVTGQYTPRDVFAAQPGVAADVVAGFSGRQVRFPQHQFYMCDRVVRSPIRRNVRGEDLPSSSVGLGHGRQYGKRVQLGDVLLGQDNPTTQNFTGLVQDNNFGQAVPATADTHATVHPAYMDWPANSPNEFIGQPSGRNFSVHSDIVVTLDPPDFQELQFPSTGQYTTTIAVKNVGGASDSTYAYNTFTAVPGGPPDANQVSADYYGDQRHLQRRYVVNVKVPLKVMQQWQVTQAGDQELRVLNRKLKMIFVHSPTRWWATGGPDPYDTGYGSVDTWPISVVSEGNSDTARRIRASVQCPSVRMNVMCVAHFNRKRSTFTNEYDVGRDIKDAIAGNDCVPGSTHMETTQWMEGDHHDHNNVRVKPSIKRKKAG